MARLVTGLFLSCGFVFHWPVSSPIVRKSVVGLDSVVAEVVSQGNGPAAGQFVNGNIMWAQHTNSVSVRTGCARRTAG